MLWNVLTSQQMTPKLFITWTDCDIQHLPTKRLQTWRDKQYDFNYQLWDFNSWRVFLLWRVRRYADM